MARQRNYWVVSPNVDGKGKNVEEWKKEVLRNSGAILGWAPDYWKNTNTMGPRFAGNPAARSRIEPGDVILVARLTDSAPEIVGFGVVTGRFSKVRLPPLKDYVYLRHLQPFKQCERVPTNLSSALFGLLRHPMAFVQLHPGSTTGAKKVCMWMKQYLGTQEPGDGSDIIAERNLSKSRTYGYVVRTRKEAREARRREKELLDNYQRWLAKQGRHLSVLPYGRLQCDGWEEKRKNLIEAKGSVSREDIRMAVGQLCDYSFQGKSRCKLPNMAILLPRKPPSERVEWLKPTGIKIIWRRGQSFQDNTDGRFI
jgi:hypothetical protein